MKLYGDDTHSSQCPFCKSDNIEAQRMEIPDGDVSTQEVHCNDCKRKWNDFYQLMGYEEIDS